MLHATPIGSIINLTSGYRFCRYLSNENASKLCEIYASSNKSSPPPVDWIDENDPDNPKNWSFSYKCFVTFLICLMTVFVYLGSSIVVPGLPQLSEDFGISHTVAALSISLFVWGYGIGPMLLSPLSEVACIGRNWPYIVSIGLFVIMQIPTALCDNIAGFLVLRFIAGFLGSPVLATGGASMADIWNLDGGFMNGIAFWSYAACGGPGMGPLLSGFAVQEKGWHWIIWPLLCGTGLVWIITFCLMPETNADTILTRRAFELRRISGNTHIRSSGEIRDSNLSIDQLLYSTLYRPLRMTFTEPVLFFSDLYIAYVYGITYCLYVPL